MRLIYNRRERRIRSVQRAQSWHSVSSSAAAAQSPDKKAVASLSVVAVPVRSAARLAQSRTAYSRGTPIGHRKSIATAVPRVVSYSS
eukprot:7381714-Prymnesium_polylepis.1